MSARRKTGWSLLLALALVASSAGASLSSQQSETKQEKPKAAAPAKKKKKARSASERPPQTTREVLSRVLRSYKQGFESLAAAAMRDWIDTPHFYDYPRFEEDVTVFLLSVGELRLFTREVSVQVEGDRAVMLVDAEMVFTPRNAAGSSETRTTQITFDFQRTSQGWKITEINPRSFFLP